MSSPHATLCSRLAPSGGGRRPAPSGAQEKFQQAKDVKTYFTFTEKKVFKTTPLSDRLLRGLNFPSSYGRKTHYGKLGESTEAPNRINSPIIPLLFLFFKIYKVKTLLLLGLNSIPKWHLSPVV